MQRSDEEEREGGGRGTEKVREAVVLARECNIDPVSSIEKE